jgi:hypothetical protein
MLVGKEMHVLQELVACDNPILVARANNGGIVPDSKQQCAALGRRDPAAYTFNQLVFVNSQYWSVILQTNYTHT